jgi:hypothetical protein
LTHLISPAIDCSYVTFNDNGNGTFKLKIDQMKISMNENCTVSLTVKDTEFSYTNSSSNYTFKVYIVFEKTPVITTVEVEVVDSPV